MVLKLNGNEIIDSIELFQQFDTIRIYVAVDLDTQEKILKQFYEADEEEISATEH